MILDSLFADVILPLPLAQTFTYSIPLSMHNNVAIGKRVVVPFGNKKIYTAIIKKIHSQKPKHYDTKEIVSILDDYSIINQTQIDLWEWISSYYQCTIGEVYKAAIPSGLKLESKTKISLNKNSYIEFSLSESEIQIIKILTNCKDADIHTLNQALNIKSSLRYVKSLLDKNIISVEEKVQNTYKEKEEKFVRINPSFNEEQISEAINTLSRSPKQQQLILNYLSISKQFIENKALKVSLKKLLSVSQLSTSIVNALVKKNILDIYKEKKDRIDLSEIAHEEAKELNPAQSLALKQIKELFIHKDINLLHGVTSSGKTEIYIHLIQEYINKGQQVLYLLPEIALTSQIITRLKKVFGNTVGVYHSKFNDAERIEIWNNIRNYEDKKSYKLILGVRSSIFLPFNNLGLIIIDEEHESSYKQYDPSPRYHARDTALVLASFFKAKTLLGTATPAIETYYNAKNNRYGLIELKERYKNIKLPEIIIANLKEAKRKKQMKSIFAPELYSHIEEALEKKEQIILFQNRRGYAPLLECNKCGWIPHCKNCDVSLTYHQYKNNIQCHYCGYSEALPSKCEKCEGTDISDKGFGTEKIQDELNKYFPEANVARMDLDTTRKKNSYKEIIGKFEDGKIDILVGTQMISKGLDFDNVSIVGVMNADSMLNFPDFRAFERAYQLMAQVAGRAGRKNKQGKVIIQTNEIDHPIIKNVVSNDYESMYLSELTERSEYIYPPFYRIIEINLKHKNLTKLNKASAILAKSLKKTFGIRIIGPQAPLINRIQNMYLLKIILKIEKKSSPAKAKWILNAQANKLKEIDDFKSLVISFNVDPM